MSLTDVITISVIVIGLAFVAGITGYIWTQYDGVIQSIPGVSDATKNATSNASTQWGGMMDWIIAAVLIGMPLISAALAYFVNTPPIFFYLSLGFLLIIVFIGWALQDAFQSMFALGGTISAYMAANMPITSYILQNFGPYTIIAFIIIAAGTYIKLRGGYGADGY